MTAIANPSNNPYEQFVGVDPRVLDTVEEERLRRHQLIDGELVAANPQFAIYALAKAGDKLFNGVPSDKSYLEGMMDALGAIKKIAASKAELGGLLLESSEVVLETSDKVKRRLFWRRPVTS